MSPPARRGRTAERHVARLIEAEVAEEVELGLIGATSG
jgi:hypothetical protein